MKKYILTLFAVAGLALTSCEDFLDRPQLNTPVDSGYWRNEADVRLFANGFYTNYFVGYNSGWGADWAPIRFYYFDDNHTTTGKQRNFENQVPSSRGSSSEATSTITDYQGKNWNFAWVRKANLFLDRLDAMGSKLSAEAYTHWHAAASFFKAFSYARLVNTFGDVPYFEKTVENTDKETMFKDRDDRIYVMDQVMALSEEALTNLRTTDGDGNTLNRYVAAAFISRWFLFEGTWQHYHNGDAAAAKKYLDFAVKAAELVMNSGKYAIDAPFHQLFGSESPVGTEALMYRYYSTAQSVLHHVASYCNGSETNYAHPNLALAKSFICQDGKVYQNSELENADVLSIANMAKTRDPRFESTFLDVPNVNSNSLLYNAKFIDREGSTNAGTTPKYNSNTNTNGAPIIRYAEVLLNWIEAKAVLAEMGGTAIVQTDLDKSINLLRQRPLDDVAVSKGLKNTVDMKLADITEDFDPARDADVSPLMWEIRRERRMELVSEHCRMHDIKRWKKLHYMDNVKYPDTMLGPWVDMAKDVPAYLSEGEIGDRAVMTEDGTVVTWDGNNKDKMVGYYIPQNASARDAFTDRSYLAPVGESQINQYDDMGFHLTQTTGW